MLLNNLSQQEEILKHLIPNESETDSKTSLLDNLIEVFCRGEGKRYNPQAEFHFLSGVLANLSMNTQGAHFMLGKSKVDGQFRLQKIIAFIGHENAIRRGGAISVIKNICFDIPSHSWLLTDPDLNLLPFLLLPLAGNEEYDEEDMDGMPDELQLLEETKQREPDWKLRLILVETLILLCSTRSMRELLRLKKVYPIVQKCHLWETNEHVQEAIERLVQLLARDEALLEVGVEELDL